MKNLGNKGKYITKYQKKYFPIDFVKKWHDSSDAIKRILHEDIIKIYEENGKTIGLQSALARELGCTRANIHTILKKGGNQS